VKLLKVRLKKDHPSPYQCSYPGCHRIGTHGWMREWDMVKHMKKNHDVWVSQPDWITCFEIDGPGINDENLLFPLNSVCFSRLCAFISWFLTNIKEQSIGWSFRGHFRWDCFRLGFKVLRCVFWTSLWSNSYALMSVQHRCLKSRIMIPPQDLVQYIINIQLF
jgi:hypothetical protein